MMGVEVLLPTTILLQNSRNSGTALNVLSILYIRTVGYQVRVKPDCVAVMKQYSVGPRRMN